MKSALKKKIKGLVDLRERMPLDVVSKINEELDYHDYRFLRGVGEFPLVDAVGFGAKDETYVVVYNPLFLKTAKTVLVGKGVVYDSGGYDIKLRGMNHMFFDKKGAILVAAYCKEHKTVPGVCFYTSNLVSDNSTVPGEIITSRDGTNVLITNTDAEGRLGLADCLSYVKEKNPKAHCVTVATLTGAAAAFTGENNYALVHSSEAKKLYPKVMTQALKGKLKLWPAPTHKDYDDAVSTKVNNADVQNCDLSGKGGGSQKAYSFLKYFNSNLTHLDIAGLMCDKDGNATADGYEEIDFVIKKLDK